MGTVTQRACDMNSYNYTLTQIADYLTNVVAPYCIDISPKAFRFLLKEHFKISP